MASLVVREEPLLKQLVRSRTLRSSARTNSSRSSSQPPPVSRETPSSSSSNMLLTPPSNNTTYTLQFLPYNVVYPKKSEMTAASLSISQPDLTKIYSQSGPIYSPPRTTGISRETSPIRGELGGGSISSSLRNSLINLESVAWPSQLASNSVLLPMTDAVPTPPIVDETAKNSYPNGICQMCYLLNKPRIKVHPNGSFYETYCNSCSSPQKSTSSSSSKGNAANTLDNPNFCMVGNAKPTETSILVNGCEIQNNGGGSIKARDGNHYAAPPAAISSSNHPSYQQHGHHQHHQQQQQRYMPRPELGTGHIPPPGHSRYTSRGVSPTKDHQQHSSSLFASIYSASGTNQGAIDNRIEQAMDLVKSHLMNAVRSEVEELKERIVKLEDVISHLQNENDYLKANVTQEVLTQLPPPTSHHQILQQGPHNASSGGGGLSPTSSTLVVANQPASQQQQQQ